MHGKVTRREVAYLCLFAFYVCYFLLKVRNYTSSGPGTLVPYVNLLTGGESKYCMVSDSHFVYFIGVGLRHSQATAADPIEVLKHTPPSVYLHFS